MINQRTVGDDLPVRNTPLSLRDLTETKIMAEGLLLTSSYHSPAPSDIAVPLSVCTIVYFVYLADYSSHSPHSCFFCFYFSQIFEELFTWSEV